MDSSEDNIIDSNKDYYNAINKADPGPVLGMLLAFLVLFTLIGTLFIFAGGLAIGYDLGEITGIAGGMANDGSKGFLKYMVSMNQIFTFLIPGLVVSWVAYKKNWKEYLFIDKFPHLKYVMLGILITLSSYPFVQFSYWINQQIPLPDTFIQMEDSTAEMLKSMLAFDSPFELILNVLIVAVLPAFAEEIVFRGILQKNFEWLFKNGHLAVWISAIIFSGIHMQFEGFLPRVVLGALLGYLFYYSKNLWIPIIAHFFNNALTLMVQSFYEDFEQTSEAAPPWWATIIFTALMVYLFSLLTKRKDPEDSIPFV